MCGIAGIMVADGLRPSERAALRPMLAQLRHRGPDDEGWRDFSRAALGHCRLSILDPAGGHQPLANEDESVWAIVNGEFFNYRELRGKLALSGHHLRGKGDSECLVHLYEDQGENCVDFLNGMFAFALWDERSGRGILARDRLGVKPLYYHFDGRRLVFASELKAILQEPDVPTRIDATALMDYLTFGFIPAPKTIYRNIRKLPAGHMLLFQDGRVSLKSYWDLQYRGWLREPAEYVSDAVWRMLADATCLRGSADVPVGLLLSGGLDSAAVAAAAMRDAEQPFTTLTCGFRERGFDERRAARRTAEILGTRHRELTAAPRLDEMARTLIRHFDEPFADASAIPMYHLCREARSHVTVALSGDGGDELLAGYRRYRFDCHEERLRRWIPRSIRRGLLGPLGAAWPTSAWIPRPLRAGATLRNVAVDPATAHGLSIATLSPTAARSLLRPEVAASLRGYDPIETVRGLYDRCDAPDHLSKCQYVDIRLGLADGILTKVDRMSMAHGLEVRSPMLDYRFAELAWSIPPRMRIRRGEGKAALRLAVRRNADARLADRPKRGFESPLDAWFGGPMRDTLAESMLASSCVLHELVRPEAILDLWEDHVTGRRRAGANLWKLLMLDAWCENAGLLPMTQAGASRSRPTFTC